MGVIQLKGSDVVTVVVEPFAGVGQDLTTVTVIVEVVKDEKFGASGAEALAIVVMSAAERPSALARAASMLALSKLICVKNIRPKSIIPNTTSSRRGSTMANSTAAAPR